MARPVILAVDPSLTATGIAYPLGDTRVLRPKEKGVERLDWLAHEVLWQAKGNDADLVALEGFSYGSKGRAVFDIAGLGWVVRLDLHRHGIPYADVSPSSLKKYATGNGNAGKPLMQQEAARRLDYWPEKPDDNEVDALWLRAMALDAYGHAEVAMPAKNREALASVEWPDL
jgi:crossover junction endodeoxyribonuclease RuvC